MRTQLISLCFFTLSISVINNAYADILKPQMIIESSAHHYPEILADYQAVQAKKTRVENAYGAFDTQLSQKTYARIDGFYDGTYLDSTLSQPVPEYNAEIYTGYRVADGTFPIYEDYFETDNSGEYYLGVKLSLLRNRLTDKNRAQIKIAQYSLLEQEIQLTLKKLTIQKNALQKYWIWLSYGQQYFAYNEILNLAQKRQKNLKQQVLHGQIASIYLQENRQYILKRQADLNIAKARFEMAAQELSLYYRSAKGTSITPTMAMLPKSMPNLTDYAHANDVFHNLVNHPAFKIIDAKRKILVQKKTLAENDLLPYLDLDVKASQDFGSGSKQYEEGELAVSLNFKVPLQRTQAKSNKALADAKLQELIYKEKFQYDKLNIALKKLLINMHNQREFLNVTKQAYALAKKMIKVEETRVHEGISDFFTLNKREEEMMKFSLQRLKAQENYLKMQEDMKMLTANLAIDFEINHH